MSLMYAQMGMKAVGAAAAFEGDRHRASMERINRSYQETMSNISASQQLNSMTRNEIQGRDAGIRAGIALDLQSMRDRAETAVSSAAAGVGGGSVRASMHSLMRSRLSARRAARKRAEANSQAYQQDRRNVAMGRAMNKNLSPLGRPSTASALLGLGASMIDVWDSNQPEGMRIEDTISGWGK